MTAIFLAGSSAGYFYFQKTTAGESSVESSQKDVYLRFLDEVYETIQENYWDKISDEKLTELFVKGIEKLSGQPQALKTKDKASLEKLLEEILQRVEDKETKKEFATKLADLVLQNLSPFGRSRLYTKKEEKALSDNVKNINPEVDQYEVLGIKKEAAQEEIEKAFEEKEKTPEVEQAYKTLSDAESRKIYDESGVEPTMDYKLIRPEIFYLHIKKFSPTTFDELKRVTEKVDNREALDTLILDLRDNVGGAIDLLPYFLGPFIGQDQYAYQFFHQEEKEDYKTRIGWLPSLVRYKKVVILINEGTQSSAEVMATVLKKYNVGVLIGAPSRGWGTIEKVFKMKTQLDPEEKHSIFLVHSLTLRDDGQPIEGRGVEPVININNPDWEQQLYQYFRYPELTEALKEVL